MSDTAPDIFDGIAVLAGRLAALPTTPGVYRMLNAAGDVLYVGKAKNLKNRVTQYTQPERMVARIRKMVFETRDLVVVETRTEAEALLLEANLIKSLKPRYNVIFRDDASYVSVVITHEETPLIRSHRGAKRAKGDYFGPYPSAAAVYQTLDVMEKAFRLRTCSDGVFRHRTRPCLKYDIKRCSAPCVGKIGADDYAQTVREAKRFLKGERQEVLADLQSQMDVAAASLHYEKAAAVRDRIKALAAVATRSTAMSHALTEADVLALVHEGGRVAVQAFYYRGGQHVGNHTFYPRYTEELADEAEMFRVFVGLHYTQRTAPPYVYCNVAPAEAPMLEEALSLSAGRRVRLEVPQRGEKAEVVAQAVHNAQQALRRKVTETDGWGSQMEAFGSILERHVQVVECYDISNISGRHAVASQVVAGPEGMLKNRYRRYTIRSKSTPDDYAMMREVLERRVARLVPLLGKDEEVGAELPAIPDVLLVDGGKGQLNVLVEVAREAGMIGHPACPALVGIAKGEERDKGLETLFMAEADGDAVNVRQLPIAHGSALIFLLQRIRDEAHRFAITFHREKRSKALVTSGLDAIPGIGPKKKKALLLHFGSLAGVQGADVAELARVPGIDTALAELIYSYFRNG